MYWSNHLLPKMFIPIPAGDMAVKYNVPKFSSGLANLNLLGPSTT